MDLFHRPVVTWLVLVGITLLSVALAEAGSLGIFMFVAVFAAAIVKGQLVALHFMETPRALPVWNSLYRMWIVAIGLALCLGVALAP